MTEEEIVKERQRRLEAFVGDNWDVFQPLPVEDCDDGPYIYTGAIMVRSRDTSRTDTEVILKVHTNIGFSEQIGLLVTAAEMMHADHSAAL